MPPEPAALGTRRRMLVDTHCHLADPAFDADRGAVLERAAAAGVAHVVVIADSPETTTRAIALAQQFGLSATAGVHPHEAEHWDDRTARHLEAALADPAVVAVGETGLDYHYRHASPRAQRRAFEAQLELAARTGKPVVVHAREADQDVEAMLAGFARSLAAVVLHSFSAGASLFQRGLALGAYFSFSGMVTFKNWPYAAYVRDCPADRLLVETDAPYLAPVPYRGRRNEPAFVVQVAERLAAVRGEPLEELAVRSTENAVRCFGPRLCVRQLD